MTWPCRASPVRPPLPNAPPQDYRYLVTITVSQGKVFALFVRSPTKVRYAVACWQSFAGIQADHTLCVTRVSRKHLMVVLAYAWASGRF